MNVKLLLMVALVAQLPAPRTIIRQARPPASSGEGVPGTQSEASLSDETGEPGLDRELFVYPAGDRRDPFERPLPGNPAGTRFEDLRLIGVIHSPNVGESVALVSSGTAIAAAAAAAGERTFRLRQDVVLGEMKVLRVEPEYVIVEIRRFGIGEQRELHLSRPPGRVGR